MGEIGVTRGVAAHGGRGARIDDEMEDRKCLVKRKLDWRRKYDAATSAFSEAVKELPRKIGTSLKEEYKRLGESRPKLA